MVNSLGHGFEMLRAVVSSMCIERVAFDVRIDLKLTEDFKIECKKFLCYRAYRIRDRQWNALQRMRGLLVMIEEARAHYAIAAVA